MLLLSELFPEMRRWNTKLKRLEITSKHATTTLTSTVGPSEKELKEFRFPEPTMNKNPVSCTSSLLVIIALIIITAVGSIEISIHQQ